MLLLIIIAVNSAWIALHDIAEEGTFVWASTNAKVADTFWAPHKPDDMHNHEDCAVVTQNGVWDDNQCEANRHAFVCTMA